MVNTFNWDELMHAWNRLILSGHLQQVIEPDLVRRGWLGRAGATDEQIEELENRIGLTLPPSYRTFLQYSNGWLGRLDVFIYKLYSTEEVVWFYERNQNEIDGWVRVDTPPTSPEAHRIYGTQQNVRLFRAQYLQTAIQISDWGDASLLLLTPEVVHEEEWEAWFLASWLPGALRYRSFWELMNSRFQAFRNNYQNEM